MKKKKKKNLYYGGHKSLMVVGDRTLAGIRPSELPLSLSRPFFLGCTKTVLPLMNFVSLPLYLWNSSLSVSNWLVFYSFFIIIILYWETIKPCLKVVKQYNLSLFYFLSILLKGKNGGKKSNRRRHWLGLWNDGGKELFFFFFFYFFLFFLVGVCLSEWDRGKELLL